MRDILGLLAGIIGVVGYIPYIRDILKHQTKPDRASWLIWSIEYSGLFAAQIARGATNSLWLIGLQLAATLAVYALSLRYGIGNFGRRTQVLLGCVCATLLVWFFTKSANTAIILLLAIEASGVVLTAFKAYKHPDSETLTMWLLLSLAGLLSAAAIGKGAAGILYLYPISLVLMSSSVVAAALLGARRARADTALSEASVADIDA